MKFAIIVSLSAFVVLAATRSSPSNFCPCTREFTPVCGTDGDTYPNPCEFRCHQNSLPQREADGLKIARNGSCDDAAAASAENTKSIDGPDTVDPYVLY